MVIVNRSLFNPVDKGSQFFRKPGVKGHRLMIFKDGVYLLGGMIDDTPLAAFFPCFKRLPIGYGGDKMFGYDIVQGMAFPQIGSLRPFKKSPAGPTPRIASIASVVGLTAIPSSSRSILPMISLSMTHSS